MTRWIAALLLLLLGMGLGAGTAVAQPAPGRGPAEITIIPGGWTFFTESEDGNEPSFGNYDLGALVTLNVTPIFSIEGEVSGALGIEQDLTFAGLTSQTRSPHLLNYIGNLVVSVPNSSAIVPYVTGGVGGMSVFERSALDIDETTTFLTGNVGAGVKWYAGRWGLRGDYRFVVVRGKDEAPEFFGQETRYGHRVYGGVMLTVGR